MLLPILLLLSHFTLTDAAVVGRRVATPTTPELPRDHIDNEHTLHGRQAQYGYTTRSPDDYQTYNGGWGEIYAPAVTRQYLNGPASPPLFLTATGYHSTLLFALQSSCSYQFDGCYNRVSSFPNNNRPFGVDQCVSQQGGCHNQAGPVASAYTASANAAATYSSSRASAAYATATAARTQAGDQQTFTGALGGYPAPAVIFRDGRYYVGVYSAPMLGTALEYSCNQQVSTCTDQARVYGNGYEFTVDNCRYAQYEACRNAITGIVRSSQAAYSASATAYSASSSLAAYSASTSEAAYSASATAYSASSSEAAYSASVSAAAYSVSATAYSASASEAAYSASISEAAYSASASEAAHSASVSDAGYSASVSAAAYSASVSDAAAAQSASISEAAYSASVSNAGYSASVSAAVYSASVSDAAYSASASEAAYSASISDAGYSASISQAAYSASISDAAYSASIAGQSASAYSASISAYSSSSSAAAAASTSIPQGWQVAPAGCIAEGPRGRALIGASTAGPDMTWKKCTDFCSGKGFAIAGLEYSSECFCGSSLANGAAISATSSNCNMKCSGNSLTICGGSNALSLFVNTAAFTSGTLSSNLQPTVTTLPTGWTAASSPCILEGSSGRGLTGASFSDDRMTITRCLDFCTTKGLQWAGVEYGRECYCGGDLENGASLDRTSTCQMACSGAPDTICGGGGRLSLYRNQGLQSAPQLGTWRRVACIKEVSGRALTGSSSRGNDMTLEKCTSTCGAKGFTYAGVEYGNECYCGNALSNGASLTATSSQCKTPCVGNLSQNCGGANALALYSRV